jgi:outer membrane protein TolC
VIDVNNIENQFLETTSALDNLRDQYITQLDRFKINLGIPIERHIDVVPLAFDLSEPEISLQEATARALALRLDLQTERDRLDDERRNLVIAKNELLPDLDLDANLTIPTDPDEDVGGVGFDPDELDYSVGITFGLPLDRRQERLRLRQSVIRLERAIRDLNEAEDNVILDARSTRRFIERARANLRLAERRVVITEQRREAQLAQLDQFTTQERLDTENDLIDAKSDRDNAETDLRIAILNYMLATGQMRVDRDGQLEPIPGMEFPPARIFADVENLDRWFEDPPLEEIERRIMEGLEQADPEGGDVVPADPVDPGG